MLSTTATLPGFSSPPVTGISVTMGEGVAVAGAQAATSMKISIPKINNLSLDMALSFLLLKQGNDEEKLDLVPAMGREKRP